MPSNSSNTKRIAKNTIVLYLRMFLMLAINLFTSRVILKTLGVSDYGIYSAVGGIVSMFTLVSGALTNSVTRFLTFELGKGDPERISRVFSTSINVMLILGFVILIIGDPIGIWFLNNKMDIPTGRMIAANWVLQCAILTFLINLISIPFNATIIAHEKMSVFAFISIIDAILKLLIVYALYITHFDRLIIYAVLLLLVACTIRFIYSVYCHRHFQECKYRRVHDKELLKSMTSFAGWNFFGYGAKVVNDQGINLLMNVFFGVTVNAARGVAVQVKSAVTHFVTNFTMALNPQITKSYAAGDLSYMHSLIFRGAKFSYFLMLFFVIPLCLETELVLKLWLSIVPPHAVTFVQLTLIAATINVINDSIIKGLHATGKIKKYMIIVGTIEVLNFPFTYFAFRMGAAPEVSYYIFIGIYGCLAFLRVFLVKDLISLRFFDYFKQVFVRCFIVTVPSLIIPFYLSLQMEDTILRLAVIVIVSMISTALSVYCFGLTRREREAIMKYLRKIELFSNKK